MIVPPLTTVCHQLDYRTNRHAWPSANPAPARPTIAAASTIPCRR